MLSLSWSLSLYFLILLTRQTCIGGPGHAHGAPHGAAMLARMLEFEHVFERRRSAGHAHGGPRLLLLSRVPCRSREKARTNLLAPPPREGWRDATLRYDDAPPLDSRSPSLFLSQLLAKSLSLSLRELDRSARELDRRPPTLFLSKPATASDEIDELRNPSMERERRSPPRKPTAFARSINEDSSSGSVESSSEWSACVRGGGSPGVRIGRVRIGRRARGDT